MEVQVAVGEVSLYIPLCIHTYVNSSHIVWLSECLHPLDVF